MKLVIEVAGRPQGKQRPRLGKHGQVYTPKETRGYETSLAWMAKVAMMGKKPLEGPLRITVTAFVSVPVSYRAWERRRALAGELWPRGDVDNFAKSALDACNGIAYLDDDQVVVLTARKAFATESLTRVEIEPLMDKFDPQ